MSAIETIGQLSGKIWASPQTCKIAESQVLVLLKQAIALDGAGDSAVGSDVK